MGYLDSLYERWVWGRAIAITYRVFVNQENSALPNLALTLTLDLTLTLTLT